MQNVSEKGELKRRLLPGGERAVQHILDAMPFYALLVDSGHNIIAVNRALERDLGLSPQELVGAYCPLVVHDRSIPIGECPLVEAIEKGEAVERDIFDSKQAQWMRLAVYPTQFATADGKPVYLHFARDITQSKRTAAELSQSLEHHSALCELLQRLQYCQDTTQTLEVLIDRITCLSWLGMAATAVGFLIDEKGLKMTAQRNLSPEQIKRCKHLDFGECLCGRVAQTGSLVVCPSSGQDHNIRYEGMGEHRHAVLPINHEGRVLGVLTLYINSEDELDTFRLAFLKAATTAAAATIAGQLAREEVRKAREKSMAQVISYQEDERKRIARELHDQVCQSLSALLLEIQTHGSQHEALREIQHDCEARVRGLIDEVRQMAAELRPTILDDYGLEMALARQVKELSSRTGLQIDYQYVSSLGQGKRLPAPIEIGLYRVAMEALGNVVAHASASQVSVIVLWQNTMVRLLIEDNGCGFDYPTIRKDIDHCQGLFGMEERIALMGGTFRVESTPQKGTTIRAEIPLGKDLLKQ